NGLESGIMNCRKKGQNFRGTALARQFKAEIVGEVPVGATEILERVNEKESYNPPLFESNGQKFVRIADSSELDAARKTANEHHAQVVT
ncbi:MAG: hypothetical protein O2857_31040, partial [Planctomycetota bacterium]|nr:hypothetical protein [Planctomycetota bacterium]